MRKRIICLLVTIAMIFSSTSVASAGSLLDDIFAALNGNGSAEATARPTQTVVPTLAPTPIPTLVPSQAPVHTPDASAVPSATPGISPSSQPSSAPTTAPSAQPTYVPSASPSASPTPTAIPALGLGSRGSDVKDLQNKLRIQGYLYDSADGIYGNNTAEAVSALQSYLSILNLKGDLDYSTIESGMADSQLLDLLNSGKVPVYYSTLKSGSTGLQVKRLQTRLAVLDYIIDTTIDGTIGKATTAAIEDFQKTNGLSVTGIADEATQLLLFSSSAKKCTDPYSRYPYKLIIDVSEQRVYVYQYANGSYSKLKARFICSTGKVETPTPLGTYRSTEPLDVWHYFRDYDCWAQYAYRIVGAIYFHSVLFTEKGAPSPTSSSVRNLGRRASHGCVRLSVNNAKWIYNNCPRGTTVVVRK